MSRKVYVKVVSYTDEEGNITPISVTWEDGRAYDVDRVADISRAFALKVGGTAIRYTVKILGKETFIFLEGSKWFVESKV